MKTLQKKYAEHNQDLLARDLDRLDDLIAKAYPEFATPEQKADWEQQAQKMKDEMRENMDQAGGALTVFGMLIALLLAVFSVGLLDLLFFFVAVGTAYKLASGFYEAM